MKAQERVIEQTLANRDTASLCWQHLPPTSCIILQATIAATVVSSPTPLAQPPPFPPPPILGITLFPPLVHPGFHFRFGISLTLRYYYFSLSLCGCAIDLGYI